MIVMGEVIPANECQGIDAGKNGGLGSGDVPPAIFLLFPQIAKTPALQNRAVLISWRGAMVSSILEEQFKLMR